MIESIERLEKLLFKYDISVKKTIIEYEYCSDLVFVDFYIQEKVFKILIIDDYQEYLDTRKLFGLFKVLDAINDIDVYSDFSEWILEYEIDPINEFIENYYYQLQKDKIEIERIIGEYKSILDNINFQFPWRDKAESKKMLKEY